MANQADLSVCAMCRVLCVFARGFYAYRELAPWQRNITNAVRKVINKRVDPRETLLDYARLIDKEIMMKRQEFGLPTTPEVTP